MLITGGGWVMLNNDTTIDVITEITSVTLVARLVPTILIDGFETQ